MNRLRPQILLALAALAMAVAGGIWTRQNEVTTVAIGGIIAIAMKVIDDES